MNAAPYVWPLLIVGMVIVPTAAQVVGRALARSATPQKSLALDMGVSESYLSRALAGEKHLPLDRLLHAGPAFLAALGEALLDAAGCERPLTRTELRAELSRMALAHRADMEELSWL